VREIPADEAARLLAGPTPPLLLDVREPWEIETAAVAGALCIPMGEVPTRLAELDKDRPVLVMCHHGRRSAQVAFLLERSGFREVINLAGGIDAWSEQVDPGIARY
jgi:rhodanese-related sulfurtransferase